MKTSYFLSIIMVSGLVAVVSEAGCSSFTACGDSEQECPDGTCAPKGYTCCGGGTSCPPTTPICGAGGNGNACFASYAPVRETCLNQGQEACYNNDGTVDCAPLGAACCGNHHWCPVGRVCINGGTACQ